MLDTDWDSSEQATDDPTTDPSAGPSAGAGPSVGPSGRDQFEEGDQSAPGGVVSTTDPWLIVAAVTVVVLLVLLLVPGARRRALRRMRQARTGKVVVLAGPPPGHPDIIDDPAAVDVARRDAHAAWSELIDTMIDFGVDVDPSETPRGTSERLQDLSEIAPPGRSRTAVLARAEERARYAPAPMRSDGLDEAVRAIRAAFAERATRGQRIKAWLFPRSVLLRWRLGWYGFYSRTVRQTGRIRDTMMLVDPRRLLARKRTDQVSRLPNKS